MIPYHNEHSGLRDYYARLAIPARRRWPLLLIVLVLVVIVLFLTAGCTRVARPLVLLVIPASPRHDIGAWLDDDTVCVPVPGNANYQVHARCLSMGTIRSLILTSRVADDEASK